jgi:hypothetical protein
MPFNALSAGQKNRKLFTSKSGDQIPVLAVPLENDGYVNQYRVANRSLVPWIHRISAALWINR